MWLRRAIVNSAVAVAAVAAVSSCGGSADEDGVKSTVKKYIEAIADVDGNRACEQLTPEARRRVLTSLNSSGAPELKARSCGEALTKLADTSLDDRRKDQLRGASVEKVSITGSSATAGIYGAGVQVQL